MKIQQLRKIDEALYEDTEIKEQKKKHCVKIYRLRKRK